MNFKIKSPSGWPIYNKDDILIVNKIIKSNKVNYWTGNFCKKFENEFAKYIGTKFGVAVMNGTVALEIALKALNIRNKDEVIVTSKSFIASASSVINVGAKPIFADINYETQNIDPHSISKLITKKTKAIICVHLAGWPCEMSKILKICKREKIYLIEDCSQAHGAEYYKKKVGSFGDISTWSFCNDKIISTAGEGGMLLMNSKKLYEKANSIKDHGKNFKKISKNKKKFGFQYVHDFNGSNYRMTEIQAGIGLSQLKKLNHMVNSRNVSLNFLWDNLRNTKGIFIPKMPSYIKHAGYRAYIFLNLNEIKSGWSLLKIVKKLNKSGVLCSTGSCSQIYKEEFFLKQNIKPKYICTNSELSEKTSIVFFLNPFMKKNELKFMVKTIKKVFIQISNNA